MPAPAISSSIEVAAKALVQHRRLGERASRSRASPLFFGASVSATLDLQYSPGPASPHAAPIAATDIISGQRLNNSRKRNSCATAPRVL